MQYASGNSLKTTSQSLPGLSVFLFFRHTGGFTANKSTDAGKMIFLITPHKAALSLATRNFNG